MFKIEKIKAGDIVTLKKDIKTQNDFFQKGETLLVSHVGLFSADLEDKEKPTRWVTDVNIRNLELLLRGEKNK